MCGGVGGVVLEQADCPASAEAWGGGLSAALFTQIFKDALHLK